MTNISKKQLEPKYLNKLFTQLNTTLSKLDKNTTGYFLEDLLGPEERIMLSKRFAIVIMLMEGNSIYRIADMLKVSTSTVTIIKEQFDNGRYAHIIKLLQSNNIDYEKLWQTLEVILRAGMPPRGKGRWKSVFKSV